MYGTTVDDEDKHSIVYRCSHWNVIDRYLIWMVYDPRTHYAHTDSTDWMVRNASRLATNRRFLSVATDATSASWIICPSTRTTIRPIGGAFTTDDSALDTQKQIRCVQHPSINPMGTPLFLPAQHHLNVDAMDDGLRNSGQQKNVVVQIYLRRLSRKRIQTPTQQNEVGLLVHTITNGDVTHGFRLWVNWIYGGGAQSVNHQTYCELMYQWKSFAQHNCHVGSALHAEIRLHSMVEADCNAEQWVSFLNELRSQDHCGRRRPNNNDEDHDNSQASPSNGWQETLRTMGTMTHMDIARWAYHALRGRVCCTSTVGNPGRFFPMEGIVAAVRGLWYLYVPDKHRWVFDRDGPNVLLEAFRVVRQHLEELCSQSMMPSSSQTESDEPQQQVGGRAIGTGATVRRSAAGVAAGSGDVGRRSFPFMVNFPEGAPPEVLHRMIVVHLDTCIGDVRQIQSILRGLAVLTQNHDFSAQLDVINEHLLPFSNGVLDMNELRLRPGRPEDMVSRGPSYAYRDYQADDEAVIQTERLLTTLFPDREIRRFILDFGGSLLRKRNRFRSCIRCVRMHVSSICTSSLATRTVVKVCS